MAGINMKFTKVHLVAAVIVAVTLLQVQGVMTQSCDDVKGGECCQARTPSCPSGSFQDVTCQMTPSTFVPATTEQPGTTEDTINSTDSDFNATDFTMAPEDEVDNTTMMSSPSNDTETTPSTTETTVILCRRCKEDHCVQCNTTTCTKCMDNFDLGNGKCVEKKDKGDEFPIAAVAGGVAAGVVVIIVVVVVVVFCCRRRRHFHAHDAMERRLQQREETKSIDDDIESGEPPCTSITHSRDYENLGFNPGNMSSEIQQGQDKMFRYTKDPTFKKPSEPAVVNDDEPEEVYGNQQTIDLHQLPVAPPPPPGAQLSKKKGKVTRREPEDVEMEEPEELYTNQEAVERERAEPEGAEQEVYYNEPEEESPYMNYNPRK